MNLQTFWWWIWYWKDAMRLRYELKVIMSKILNLSVDEDIIEEGLLLPSYVLSNGRDRGGWQIFLDVVERNKVLVDRTVTIHLSCSKGNVVIVSPYFEVDDFGNINIDVHDPASRPRSYALPYQFARQLINAAILKKLKKSSIL